MNNFMSALKNYAKTGIMAIAAVFSIVPFNGVMDTNLVFAETSAQNDAHSYGTLPTVEARAASYTKTMQISAYTSRVEECDSTPFITASNTTVRFGEVASNQFPFGTRIKIPALFGDQVFVVEDRMNTRYTNNIDVWMSDLSAAKQFGRQTATVEIYPVR